MKFTLNHQELCEAVSIVSRAVSAKSSLPALEGILIRAEENGKVFFAGYDLEMAITTEAEARVAEAGSVVVNARLISEMVRRMNADHVSIETDENNMAQIKCGNSEFSIIGISALEYPEIPPIDSENQISLSQAMLKSMIHQTLFAVAVSDTKPVQKGTLFEITDSFIRLVSVDGFRLAMRTEPARCENNMKFVVPGKTLSEIAKLLGDTEEEILIHIGKRHIQFTIGGYQICSRLLDGEFLNYRANIPRTCTSISTVKTSDFISAVERVSLIISDRALSPVRCEFDDRSIRIFCNTAMGKANDVVEASMEGDPVEIAFNNRYMLDALRASGSDEVKIELSGSFSPMKIIPVEGEEFLFLILPVRIRNEI